ncbi:heme biosynthesis protein HemY [Pararhizobium haloflavum]|uniref:heme biosynthesis protein HemY n=1 Tax=Pararhizobium haloflavum TaxID=2037914 RepID=UPI000C186DC2|nr:heme biosynthesis protein HemY [Pararhizobium haloflavum]
MIRILFFVAVILALGLSFAWLADRPGEMILVWQGQRVEMSLLAGIAGLTTLLAAIVLVLWLIKAAFSSPESVRRYFRHRKRDQGYKALSSGLIAAGAGDAMLARRMTRRSRSLLSADKEPLIHVLEAQTYMIEGRHDDARAKFEAMAENPETRALGLRGLYLEARRLGSDEAAQHYAERAVEKAPHLPWAGQAALEYRSRDGNYDQAIKLLEKQRSNRSIDKTASDRKRAVLLTGRAISALESDPRQASIDAQEANRLAPTLVPAAVTAAKALFRLNDLRRGSKILEKAWKTNPHPEIADSYVRARVGDSVQDRLKRAKRLETLRPNHFESLRIVAQSALDAHDHKLARERAEAALRQHPREGIYLLLADIEEADTGDQGRVRHWMAQALRADRDPVWTADGYVSENWAPISPVTGELDAFVWKVPVEQIGGHQIDDKRDDARDADEAIRSLPPVEPAKPKGPAPQSPAWPKAEKQSPEQNRQERPASEATNKAAVTDTVKPEGPVASDQEQPTEKPAEPIVAQPAVPQAVVASPEPAEPAKAGGPEEGADKGAVVIPLQKPRRDGAKNDAVKASGAGAVATDRPPEAQSTTSAGAASVPPKAAGKSGPIDSDQEKEQRFLTHRIDDPGVNRETQQTTTSGSKFRLF